MQDIIIAPSILSADFAKLGQEITAIDKAGADWIHIDVMDGHFVPNLTIGAGVVKALRPYTSKIFDCHLMVEHPEYYIDAFADAGANIITIHSETGYHIDRVIQQIKAHNIKVGIALNPATPLESLRYMVDVIDLILVMSVNPGFGGQSFIPHTLQKIRDVKNFIGERPVTIEVDGGVNSDNAGSIIKAGAHALVAGSAVFKNNDAAQYAHNINAIRHNIANACHVD